jgi:excisionase family DNA binding protein
MDGVSLVERSDTRYLTPREIATQLGVSTKTVHRLVDAGQLRALRVGPRLLRVRPEDFAEFVSERESGP